MVWSFPLSLFLLNFVSNSYDSSSLEPNPLKKFSKLFLPHRKYSQNLEILGAIKNPSPHCSQDGFLRLKSTPKRFGKSWFNSLIFVAFVVVRVERGGGVVFSTRCFSSLLGKRFFGVLFMLLA
ncbi:hypothetical protein KY284_035686 [Solanum tuberosum]|nr:hypothetical protein KY284_035686 [Solanum tuberosum]